MRIARSVSTLVGILFIMATVVVPSGAATPAPITSHSFHIQNQWNIGGNGGWGFLAIDPPTHRLYIPRTNRISVVDSDTGKTVGEIQGMSNLRDLALDDSGKYGYATDVTDGTAGFVRVFDRVSLKLIASIPTGPIPDAIVFDPATKLVFAFSYRARNVAVIDTSINQVVSTIPLAGHPGSATGDNKGGIFVALPARGEIQRIDAVSRKVTASWPLAPCTGPSGLTIDVQHHELFTTCEDRKLVAVDATNGKVKAIGDAPKDAGDLDFDPRLNLLFLADPAGSLTIFHRESPLRYTMLRSVNTEAGARTMVVNHNDGKAYLVTAKYGVNSGNVSEELRYRPTPIPGSFSIFVVSR